MPTQYTPFQLNPGKYPQTLAKAKANPYGPEALQLANSPASSQFFPGFGGDSPESLFAKYSGVGGSVGGTGSSAPSGNTVISSPGNLVGAPSSYYSEAYGGIPQVPDPTITAKSALSGNLANTPDLENLATELNTFSNKQAVAPYIANLPNYQEMVAQASKNTLSNLMGQVPEDVWWQLQQRGAERGAAIGSPGSPNSEAAMLRALGLTSLDLQKLGQQQVTENIARTPVGQQLNLQNFLITPEQQQAAQMAANLYSSAPIPAAAAQANLAALLAAAQMGARSTGGGGGMPSYSLPTLPGYQNPGLPTSSYSGTTRTSTPAPAPSLPANISYNQGQSPAIDAIFGPDATISTAAAALNNPMNLGGYDMTGSNLANDLPYNYFWNTGPTQGGDFLNYPGLNMTGGFLSQDELPYGY